MKRNTILLISLLSLATLAACGGDFDEEDDFAFEDEPDFVSEQGAETGFASIEDFENELADYLGYDDVEAMFDYLDTLPDDEVDSILLDYLGFDSLDELDAFFDALEAGEKVDLAGDAPPALPANFANPTLVIEPLPAGLPPQFDAFDRQVSVYGVETYAAPDVPDDKLLHATTVMAEYLDNNEDGAPDNPAVVNALLANKAGIIMFGSEASPGWASFEQNGPPDGFELQPLYAFETLPGAMARGQFDPTLEEVFHIITAAGYAYAYPGVWGENPGTSIDLAMNAAQAAGHYDPFANEPGMDYPSQISEYVYWAMTSILGAQDLPGRLDEIGTEWSLNTRAKVQSGDPVIYGLLTDPAYAFPTVLPDGIYSGG